MKKPISTLHLYLYTNLDCSLVALMISFSSVIIVSIWLGYLNILYLYPSILLLIFSIGWIFLRKRISTDFELGNSSYTKILMTLFFILLAASIFILYARPTQYERPTLYYLLMAVMVGIVFIQILGPVQRMSYLILVELIIIGIYYTWSQQLIFPQSMVGTDTWFHSVFTEQLINQGSIPTGLNYSNLPIFHLLIGSVSIICSISYKDAAMLSVGSTAIICSTIFIFLIGKTIVNKQRVCLLASLVLNISGYQLFFSYEPIPTTLASIFFTIIIYLLLRKNLDNSIRRTILIMFFMLAIIWTHTITSLALSLILITMWVVYLVLPVNIGNIKYISTLSMLFATSMFSWWVYASNYVMVLQKLVQWGFDRDYLYSEPHIQNTYLGMVPIVERFMNQLSLFTLFSIAIIGIFYLLSIKGNKNGRVLVLMGVTTLSIAFISPIINIAVIEQRWWFYSQILTAVPIGLSLLIFLGSPGNHKIKTAFLVGFIISISFFSMIGASTDSSDLMPDVGYREALTQSELQAIVAIEHHWSGILSVDGYYAHSMMNSNHESLSLDDGLYSGDYEKYNDTYILLRKEIIDKTFTLYGGPFKLNYNPENNLYAQNYSETYCSNTVDGYNVVR